MLTYWLNKSLKECSNGSANMVALVSISGEDKSESAGSAQREPAVIGDCGRRTNRENKGNRGTGRVGCANEDSAQWMDGIGTSLTDLKTVQEMQREQSKQTTERCAYLNCRGRHQPQGFARIPSALKGVKECVLGPQLDSMWPTLHANEMICIPHRSSCHQ